MTVKIRPIVLKDAASYRRAWDATAKERLWAIEFKAPPLSEVRALLRDSLRRKLPFLVAVDGEHIVGWVCVFGPSLPSLRHCVDLGMAILPGYREQGLGTKLLAGLLKMCRGKYDSVALFVFGKNKRAQGLYKKMGFKPCGGIKNAVKGLAYGYDDTLLMQKQLQR